jgi:hypothetical protein
MKESPSMFSVQKLLAVSSLALCAQGAMASDGIIESASVEFGVGAKVQTLRGGIQRSWDREWFKSNGTHVRPYWDFSLALWHGTQYRNVSGQSRNLAVIGATPVFRFERDDRKGWFAEAGIGYYLFSELYNNDDNRLSTAFQFGDHLGLGYVFDNKWQATAKLQHYSNARIKQPNSGVNFAIIQITRPF